MLSTSSSLRNTAEPLAERPERSLRVVHQEPRAAVLLNAHAKRVTKQVRDRLAAVVSNEDLFFSESVEEAASFAETILQRRYKTVLVGGGDGTLTQTINLIVAAAERLSRGNRRHALPDIALLKLGTGNGLAHLSGAGHYLEDTQKILAGEASDRMNIRLLEDKASRWVFPFASMGYDAQVLNDFVAVCSKARSRLTRALAKSLLGYFWAVGTRTIPAEIQGKRASIQVSALGRSSMIDPETREEIPLERDALLFDGPARAVLVGTTPYYGFGLKALPFARQRSDRFHLRVSTASIGFLLTRLPSVWRGTVRTPDFVDFLCEEAVIESSNPLPTQMAGDAKGWQDKLHVRLSPRRFQLVQGSGTPHP